jgi:hypothetical protein
MRVEDDPDGKSIVAPMHPWIAAKTLDMVELSATMVSWPPVHVTLGGIAGISAGSRDLAADAGVTGATAAFPAGLVGSVEVWACAYAAPRASVKTQDEESSEENLVQAIYTSTILTIVQHLTKYIGCC